MSFSTALAFSGLGIMPLWIGGHLMDSCSMAGG
jgi:hypothetical protein